MDPSAAALRTLTHPEARQLLRKALPDIREEALLTLAVSRQNDDTASASSCSPNTNTPRIRCCAIVLTVPRPFPEIDQRPGEVGVFIGKNTSGGRSRRRLGLRCRLEAPRPRDPRWDRVPRRWSPVPGPGQGTSRSRKESPRAAHARAPAIRRTLCRLVGSFDRHYGIFEGCGSSLPFDTTTTSTVSSSTATKSGGGSGSCCS